MRRIAVIAPMLDEAGHVELVVEDLASQDFDGDVRFIVADGGSTDGSVERLREAAERTGLRVDVIENPERWVSHGLNRCIRAAGDADLIVRVDCHARYPADYLRRCAEAAEATGAWNVGGIVRPVGRTPMERAVACAMDSPFGGINWTRHGASRERVEVDTVAYGAFRPVAFERAGLYDESLVRNQDDELNVRIRRAGGTIVLDRAIRPSYVPRGSLGGVYRQYWEYGYWKVAVMRKHGTVTSVRGLAPVGLVGSLGALCLLGTRSQPARRLLTAELAVYAAAACAAAAVAVRGRGEAAALIPRTASVFPAFHLGYGLGMLAGMRRFRRYTL